MHALALARTIFSQEADPRLAIDAKVDVLEELLRTLIPERNVLEPHDREVQLAACT